MLCPDENYALVYPKTVLIDAIGSYFNCYSPLCSRVCVSATFRQLYVIICMSVK